MTPKRGRPELPPDQRRVVVAVRLHPDVLARLDAIAEEKGTSRSVEINEAILFLFASENGIKWKRERFAKREAARAKRIADGYEPDKVFGKLVKRATEAS
jgi:predicted transcriptional regulator